VPLPSGSRTGPLPRSTRREAALRSLRVVVAGALSSADRYGRACGALSRERGPCPDRLRSACRFALRPRRCARSASPARGLWSRAGSLLRSARRRCPFGGRRRRCSFAPARVMGPLPRSGRRQCPLGGRRQRLSGVVLRAGVGFGAGLGLWGGIGALWRAKCAPNGGIRPEPWNPPRTGDSAPSGGMRIERRWAHRTAVAAPNGGTRPEPRRVAERGGEGCAGA
jgi:hypothetical protein